ncbi:unnamed protein product [Sphenostylis stenocarpa]|uniref:Uncharacterized protein n=1 Tax=Sphenostylis stenocarpa TaxID=92480 RepID=A0AA86SXC2_9FABA|nr:unnamed protein product [Sphenostylis stenocarpa]
MPDKDATYQFPRACGVSFQSTLVLAMALSSSLEEVTLVRVAEKGNPSKGSHMSKGKGSTTLLRLPSKKLRQDTSLRNLVS